MAELQDSKDLSRAVVARREIFRGFAFGLVSEDVLLAPADPHPATRDFVDHPGAVAIVALREEKGEPEVLLLRQYRHPVRALLWEVPAGLLDVEGEDPAAAAARELAEEASLRADRWDVLVDYFTTPGGNSESLRIFLARDLQAAPLPAGFTRQAEERDMELRWVPLSQAVQAVHAGHLHNPSAVVGVLATASALADPRRLRPVDAHWLR
ncbi:NUDIX domain-containing protein [Buchananella hordeovulneris]|uniref:ADP-ribose diphosphatase n=1 Tax=Buchananella hordeovulneris TaxID=52770 RepID=A0A1Q5PXT0_9ACTO|nr:NUDIX hydrolase [Buchananella hordeovulneris]MDO5081287.1 NUDIX hydrolase [Buchananella hordeovulneris]OKL52262.1 ADP-ribose diphosphatase [Buchananella hordeovulneris]RRD45548.1 NUDIX hydrolase [Buchananella hordeovulneris]RRD52323.1 NUDIX hydrolase [Buchananella hordeovulneris]